MQHQRASSYNSERLAIASPLVPRPPAGMLTPEFPPQASIAPATTGWTGRDRAEGRRDDDLISGNHRCVAINVHVILRHYLRTKAQCRCDRSRLAWKRKLRSPGAHAQLLYRYTLCPERLAARTAPGGVQPVPGVPQRFPDQALRMFCSSGKSTQQRG